MHVRHLKALRRGVRGAILCALPLCVLTLAGCGQPQWTELAPTDSGVRIEMPGKWTILPGEIPGERRYGVKSGGADFLFAFVPLPPQRQGADFARQVLRDSRDGAVAAVTDGKLLGDREIETQGHPGLAYEIESGNGEQARCRAYIIDGKLAMLVVASKGKPRSEADVTKFFDSFAVVKDETPADAGHGGPAPSASHSIAAGGPAAGGGPVPHSVPAAGDGRTRWHYENAPPVFPDQTAPTGDFVKTGDGWAEQWAGGSSPFTEADRTPEFVELERPGNGFRVRLYPDRSEYRFANSAVWQPMYPGGWTTP